MAYRPQEIEPRWQKHWAAQRAFRTGDRAHLPKYYVLDMFPYPSGAGLHTGHVEGYTASDIVARFKRMKGFDVLHPMGWDAFGLPAEQYAIEKGVHPEVSTRANIDYFREQLQSMGFSYDWEREICTYDPEFYKWTQWIFLKLYEHGLAYQAEAVVNWCPALGTVLANDEVIDGVSERGGHPVVRKPMRQWMLRITKYADRLLEGLERVDFPESIKAMQRDRIGRSEGADARFPIAAEVREILLPTFGGSSSQTRAQADVGKASAAAKAAPALDIFTTRPDTMFGATFCVLAPEHPLVEQVTTAAQRARVRAYVEDSARKSELERSGPEAGKSGVFTGAHAMNPATGKPIPIWVADYVLMGYGTGAIMSVPGHDQRDWEFARQFKLPVVEVITGGDLTQRAHEGEGTMVNSGFLNGLPSKSAIARMIQWLEEKKVGAGVVRYRMRDWIFARQRYWGEPVPMVIDDQGVAHPLPESALPLTLPPLDDFHPSADGRSPLARDDLWVNTTVPGETRPAKREVDTMPGAAGSSWYFLRYIDPKNQRALCDKSLAQRWMPVDLYIGGAEHAVGHLIYSRFWTKFLFDIGFCPVDEPYKKLVNQGMILGEDHRKMSKRYGNTLDPKDISKTYGADALRMFEMFMGPVEADKPWSTGGLEGLWRFLNRVWRLYFDEDDKLHAAIADVEPGDKVNRSLHKTIDKVDGDTERLSFNTAIAQMMTFLNDLSAEKVRPRAVMETFVLLLAPYAPHFAEEIWQRLGHNESLAWHPFPKADPRYLIDATIEVPLQVNGRLRDKLEVAPDIAEADIKSLALASEKAKPYLDGKEVVKFIYVPGRMVTLVVK